MPRRRTTLIRPAEAFWTTLLASALAPVGGILAVTALEIGRTGQLEMVFSLPGLVALAVLFGFLPALAGVLFVGWPTLYVLHRVGYLGLGSIFTVGAGSGAIVALAVHALVREPGLVEHGVIWITAGVFAAIGMIVGLAGPLAQLDTGARRD